MPQEGVLVHELVDEFLKWHGYEHARLVFRAEAGQPETPALGRDFIAREVGIAPLDGDGAPGGDDAPPPLLYSLISSLSRARAEASPAAAAQQHRPAAAAQQQQSPERLYAGFQDADSASAFDPSAQFAGPTPVGPMSFRGGD